VIKLKRYVTSRWQKISSGEYRLVRDVITASSEDEATRICAIRQLNEVVQPLK
jgi:hypothetical protein